MAYDDYDDDEPRTAEELLASVRDTLTDLEARMQKISEEVEDSAASVRMDIGLSRREMAEVRSSLGRLQARFDNQLMVLVLGNIASGVGVAALILGASNAF